MRTLMPVIFAAACLWGGCAGPAGEKPPRPVRQLDAIEMWASPLLGPQPGRALGVGVQVYLYQLERPEPVLGQGTLRIYAFDSEKTDAEPLEVWTYQPQDLQQYQAKTIVGWSYKVPALFEKPPAANKVTVVAQFLRLDGRMLTSAPASVVVR